MIAYHNDGKEKRQSHEMHLDKSRFHADFHWDIGCAAFAADKPAVKVEMEKSLVNLIEYLQGELAAVRGSIAMPEDETLTG